MKIRFVLLACLSIAGVAIYGTAKADTSFSVTNNLATAYVFSGIAGNNPTLTLTKGQTYNFQVNAAGHPFFISTAANSPGGPHFTTGVTNENVQSGTLVFVVPASAPATLFYQCGIHSGMSGQLNIVSVPPVPALGMVALLMLGMLLSIIAVVVMRRRARMTPPSR